MVDGPTEDQKQHYISKFLIKQWAENGEVGVVSTYHRGSATVSAAARTLHSVVEVWPRDLESEWSKIESRAKDALDELNEALGPDAEDLAAAEARLAEPDNLRSLIDLAVLHDARSLAVPLEQFYDEGTAASSAQAEAMIQARWDEAQCYHDYGILVALLPPDAHVPLGAAPVFDLQRWDGREPSNEIFMMPLTPRIVITGTSRLPRGQAEVVQGNIEQDNLLWWQLAGQRGLFNSLYLICAPSALERIAERALHLTTGAPAHSFALLDRMDLAVGSDGSGLRADWMQRIERHERNQNLHDNPNTLDSERELARAQMAEDAHGIQADLDRLRVPICACKEHRAGGLGAMWEAVMPQVVCDAMHREWNSVHR